MTDKTKLPECSVFVGVSLDGFLARPDGGLDWLTGDGAEEDHGYDDFIAGIDIIVMGRKTFEKVMTFDKWYYGNMPLVVLSSRPVDLSQALAWGGKVEQMSGSPAEIVLKLGARGVRHIYIDGGGTIQGFLRAGLIHRMILSRLPVLIGQGIPLFGPLTHDIRLKHIATRIFGGAMVQSEYQISVNHPLTEAPGKSN